MRKIRKKIEKKELEKQKIGTKTTGKMNEKTPEKKKKK